MQFYIVLLLALTYSYATSRRSHTPLVNGPASFRGSETKEPGCLSDTEISDFELEDQSEIHCGLEFYNSESMVLAQSMISTLELTVSLVRNVLRCYCRTYQRRDHWPRRTHFQHSIRRLQITSWYMGETALNRIHLNYIRIDIYPRVQ